MRLRWYGETDSPTRTSTLEIKHKQAELGWKESFPITAKSLSTEIAFLKVIQLARPSLSMLKPTLHNNYLRSYYVSSDQKFRITIDTEQRFRLPFRAIEPLDLNYIPVILELKYAAEDAKYAREITDYFKFRQTKNSKYVTGIERLYL